MFLLFCFLPTFFTEGLTVVTRGIYEAFGQINFEEQVAMYMSTPRQTQQEAQQKSPQGTCWYVHARSLWYHLLLRLSGFVHNLKGILWFIVNKGMNQAFPSCTV